MYRRFGTVRHRLLLYRQQELYTLERELFQLDKDDEASKNWKTSSIKRDKSDNDSKRPELMNRLEDKLKRYGKSL